MYTDGFEMNLQKQGLCLSANGGSVTATHIRCCCILSCLHLAALMKATPTSKGNILPMWLALMPS